MGVNGLRRFLSQNCPDTLRRRNIVLITSTYRRKTSKTPIIVVDAPTCVFGLFEKIDLQCAGNFQDFKEIVQRFVDAFRKNNIKLIFFFDGWIPNDRLEKYWRGKRAKEVRAMQNTMDEIESGELENAFKEPKMLKWVEIFFRLTLKVLYKDDPLVEVYTAMENCRTVVVADYANSNDGVAILSDDTIYLYYTDTVPVMSCRKLDLSNMTTVISNRNEICRQLQIKKEHLKILASLSLSDGSYDLKKFYPFYDFISDGRYEHRTPPTYPFGYILKYIKLYGNRTYQEMVEKLAEDVTMHGTEDLANFLREYLTVYDEAERRNTSHYRSYDESEYAAEFTNHESIVNFFTKKVTTCELFTMSLEVMNNFPVVIWTTPLQNEDDSTLIGHVELFRPIRQRLYGFIINSPGIEEKNITEVWASFEYEHTEESVDPILGPFNELSMIDLWKNQPIEIDLRIDCLLKCFGFTVDDSWLPIPIKYQPLAIVLRYMFKHPRMTISEWEIGSFILQAIVSSVGHREKFHQIEFGSLDLRCCHLAGLFMDGIIMCLNVTLCCGLDLQSYMPWNYFDGKKFQYYYQKMKSGLTAVHLLSEIEEDVLLLNNQLFAFITN